MRLTEEQGALRLVPCSSLRLETVTAAGKRGEDRDILRELGDKIIASLSQPYSIEGSRCTIGA